MKLYTELEGTDFEERSWCCEDFWQTLHNAEKENEFNQLCEDMFPDGIDETAFNDWLRFETDSIYDMLGISEEDTDNE